MEIKKKNWIEPTDKATLVENRKPRYKSSIVARFSRLTGANS